MKDFDYSANNVTGNGGARELQNIYTFFLMKPRLRLFAVHENYTSSRILQAHTQGCLAHIQT
jgi:hypothetical protein